MKDEGNLFSEVEGREREVVERILETEGFRIERIFSHGHASAPGHWYDQDRNEWVALLRGTAALSFADGRTVEMKSGDYLLLERNVKHRVERASEDALWIGVLYSGAARKE
jgi:cupin 2 domain-containing protein